MIHLAVEVRGFDGVGMPSKKLSCLSLCAFAWIVLLAVSVHGAAAWKVLSPDGKITLYIQQQADKSLTHSDRLGDSPVIEEVLHLFPGTHFSPSPLPSVHPQCGPSDGFHGRGLQHHGRQAPQHQRRRTLRGRLYENGFSYWGNAPEIYRSIPAAMRFLKKCPAAWDETRFVDGYPGEYVVMAWRKGDTWFIGGMQNRPARTVTVPLGFLDRRADYQLELHHDGADKHKIKTETQSVKANDELKLRLLENGGFCGVVSPQKL